MTDYVKAIWLIVTAKTITKIADRFQRKADIIGDLNRKSFSLIEEQKKLLKETADIAVICLSESSDSLNYKIAQKQFKKKKTELIKLEKESIEFEKIKKCIYRKNWNAFDKILWKIMNQPMFRGHKK